MTVNSTILVRDDHDSVVEMAEGGYAKAMLAAATDFGGASKVPKKTLENLAKLGVTNAAADEVIDAYRQEAKARGLGRERLFALGAKAGCEPSMTKGESVEWTPKLGGARKRLMQLLFSRAIAEWVDADGETQVGMAPNVARATLSRAFGKVFMGVNKPRAKTVTHVAIGMMLHTNGKTDAAKLISSITRELSETVGDLKPSLDDFVAALNWLESDEFQEILDTEDDDADETETESGSEVLETALAGA